MMIMAFYPYAEMVIFGGIKLLSQIMDKSCMCCEKHKTKATTPFKFITLYAGPAYLMHFKYSSIMTQIFISFMYGLFVPVLFPIATVGILNMYIVEKAALLYYYRKPPMYDDKLQKRSLEILEYAPLGMFVMGYWALGNTQLFFGATQYRIWNNTVVNPLHPLVDGHGLNQTHWILIMLVLYGVKVVFIDGIRKCVQYICSCCCQRDWSQSVLETNIREELGGFWYSLTGDDQKKWYTDEVYTKHMYGIETVDKDALNQMRTADRRKAKKIEDGNG